MDTLSKDTILKNVEQKLRRGERVILIFEAYQVIGAEHQNRLLAVVQSGRSSALFSFNVSNFPPVNLSDLTIHSVFPIDSTFIIDTANGFGVSSHQFQILSGNEQIVYYYYPDDGTIRSKEKFELVLKKLIQEYSESDVFDWLEIYKRADMMDINPQISNNKLPPKNRESKFREELDRRKPEYTMHEPYKIYCGTWNVNLNIPKEELCLREWLATTEDAPDIYAIGFQEIDMSADTIIFGETRPDYGWVAKIMEGLHPAEIYEELITVRLVGMMLTIAIKRSLRPSVSKCCSAMVGTGTLKLGNKGGVGVSFQLNETLICFVNSHLAAHVQEFERRNEDHDEILRRMQFNDGFRTRSIEEHHQIFWIGDLNYRVVTADEEQIKTFCNYETLCFFDQLYVERQKKRVFVDFNEGKIKFRPTYKYDPGSDNWDSSEKMRAPAWCDRIFWKGARIEQICYDSVMELRLSDHKPVYGVFIAYILTRDEQKFKRVHEEVLKTVDKFENDNQPQITVAETDLDFGVIRFHECYNRELLVANNCHLPVHFQFSPKDDSGTSICEDWIKISHKKGELLTGNSLSIRIDIFIDEKAVAKLTRKLKDASAGMKIPLDILVLHVENGRDIFITIFGEYQPSIFGFKMETLMKLTKPLIEYNLHELVAIDEDLTNSIPYHKNAIVPRELWLLTDYLFKSGIQVQHLFTLNRKHRSNPRICGIRDWLDAWSLEPFPGTPHTAAEALLKILESLPEPLVSLTERELSIYCAYFDRCKELLQNKIPLLNRKIFLYICMFLKELQKNYSSNYLDDRLLATVFSNVLFRHHNEQYCQRFMLNFLTNDITDFAKNEFAKQ